MWANRPFCSPKMSNFSKLVRLLTKNDRPWVNRSGRSPKRSEWANCSFFWANCSFAHFFAKNEQFAQKTDERIPSPALISLNINQSHSFLTISHLQKYYHPTALKLPWYAHVQCRTLEKSTQATKLSRLCNSIDVFGPSWASHGRRRAVHTNTAYRICCIWLIAILYKNY